jgi:uncharacterized protein with PIN domain
MVFSHHLLTVTATHGVSTMKECPYCGSELNGAVSREEKRSGPPAGHKSTSAQLVSCPDCDGVIDGFTPH